MKNEFLSWIQKREFTRTVVCVCGWRNKAREKKRTNVTIGKESNERRECSRINCFLVGNYGLRRELGGYGEDVLRSVGDTDEEISTLFRVYAWRIVVIESQI